MMARLMRVFVSLTVVALLASLAMAGSAGAQIVHLVTNENDSGPGSFRQALDDAECGGGVIVFAPGVEMIELINGLEYDCFGANLTIRASGVMVTPGAGWTGAVEDDLFAIGGSGRVTIEGLTLEGDGVSEEDGLDVEPGGDLTVVLRNVTIANIAEDGIDWDDEAGGIAAATLKLIDAEIRDVDREDDDEDGIDLDHCDGDVTVELVRSQIFNSGGHGVQIDQCGFGGVHLSLTDADVVGSGDEGVDIEEYDDGDVTVTSTATAVNGNGVDDEGAEDEGDEGYEFDEYDNGDLTVTFNGGVTKGNSEDGVDASEDGSGRFRFTANDSTFDDNGEDGLDLDEYGSGNQVVTLRDTSATGNGDGVSTGDAGLEVDGDSFTRVAVRNSALTGNSAGSGIDIDAPIGFGYALGTDLSGNSDGSVDSTIPFFVS